MGIRRQLYGFTFLSLGLLTVLLSASFLINIRRKASRDLSQFETTQKLNLENRLKSILDIAASTVQAGYQDMQNEKAILSYIKGHFIGQDTTLLNLSDRQLMGQFSQSAVDSMQRDLLVDLSRMRYNDGKGYFWVTTDELPYPTMLMHPQKQNLEGVVLSSEDYNVSLVSGKNIYAQRVRLSRNPSTKAILSYSMNKSGEVVSSSKTSYSIWFEELGWVVSSGLSTDYIQQEMAVYEAAVRKQTNQTIWAILGIATFLIIITFLSMRRLGRRLVMPLQNIKDKLSLLAQGELAEKVEEAKLRELNEMSQSVNQLGQGIGEYTAFAEAIGKGELATQFSPKSERDILGHALVEMRDSLKASKEIEDQQHWATEGIAQFGELLNQHVEKTETLLNSVLQLAIKFLNANQGALYLMNGEEDQDPHLMRVAYYAYEREKKANQRINPGQGLNGQCMLEKDTLYITDVPADFVSINSGLGKATPRNIVIVPMMSKESFLGTIELATFQQLKPYQVEFLERVAELIANNLTMVQANVKIQTSLDESQRMAEQLRAQEEELRQNQEELQATHEEMRRKQQELEISYQEAQATIERLEKQNGKAYQQREISWDPSENAA